ncbi:MAG: acyl-CoA thioesterase [Inquilinus sp.]|nr:acyl-CoA thioesterase [Inquilinus sp.]
MAKFPSVQRRTRLPTVPPDAEPALRTIAMPADANPNGDIFGGWLLSQMDLAGSVVAYERAQGRIATVAIDAMSFVQPVFIGDLVTSYAEVVRVGRTSIQVRVDTFVKRRESRETALVTEGLLTYVAIDRGGRPRPVPEPGAPIKT